MGQVFFHCSNAQGVILDRRGTVTDDLPELHEYAVQVIRSLIATPSPEDWRNWVLHVSDEMGDDLFEMAFASLLGKPH
ncbi:MAG TPA: hypothetical protein VMH84_11950 [Xanthobacteraceae bacterium]|nr:hypothetical protein [Xanthobacteraceae bacterium]